jgi:DNA-binding PadR family transcriptional regulator
MGQPVPDLPPHWFQILLALADQDRHGLGIMADVLDRTGGRMKLWPGMLYRNLSKLADEGLVVEVETPPGAEAAGGRPRFYRITPLGRRACAAEAERLNGFVQAARQKKLLKA